MPSTFPSGKIDLVRVLPPDSWTEQIRLQMEFQDQDIWKCDLEPGTYFIGDPGYVVDYDLWVDRIGTYGLLTNPKKWVKIPTACGDGRFLGSNHHTYQVDSGCFGLVPMSMSMFPADPKGTIHTFNDRFTFCVTSEHDVNGPVRTFTISDIVITTY